MIIQSLQTPMEQKAGMYLATPPLTVASLYPFEIRYSRPYKTKPNGGHHTEYRLEASDGKTPSYIKIGPGGQWTHVGGKQSMDIWDSRENCAADFVRHARNAPLVSGDDGPAIWICKGEEATEEECNYYVAGQIKWCRVRIAQADDWFLRGLRSQIGNLDRELAKYMRLKVSEHPWMRLDTIGDTKTCPACTKEINAVALVCEFCKFTVDPVGMKALQEYNDRILNGTPEAPPTLPVEIGVNTPITGISVDSGLALPARRR